MPPLNVLCFYKRPITPSKISGLWPKSNVTCVLILYMLASHCPDIYTRWTHEYENSYFARSGSRYKSKTSLQPKKLQCLISWTLSFLLKVTRYTHKGLAMAPDTITKSHPTWYFPQEACKQGTLRPRDEYTVSKWWYDVCKPGREGVTWPPSSIKLLANGAYKSAYKEQLGTMNICSLWPGLFRNVLWTHSLVTGCS